MSAVEGFIPVNGSAGNSAPVGGRRRSHKKLRLVKKSTVRRMLKSKGLKMRGGDAGASDAAMGQSAGRRHRKSHKKTHRRRRSLFGMKY
jgi:hypothetical protein